MRCPASSRQTLRSFTFDLECEDQSIQFEASVIIKFYRGLMTTTDTGSEILRQHRDIRGPGILAVRRIACLGKSFASTSLTPLAPPQEYLYELKHWVIIILRPNQVPNTW